MKTIKQAQDLHDALVQQVADLPARNSFGESNAKEKNKMLQYIKVLKNIIEQKPSDNPDIDSWMNGNDDAFLSDFL